MRNILDLVLFAIAVAFISKGADWFTEAAVKIAEATHVPKVIIGATIVSIATTMPEFSVSAIATIQNHTDMAIGNAIGSAICNIGLILGTCTLAKASATDRNLLTQQGGFMIGSGILIFLLTLSGGLSRIGGIILVVGLATYIYYSVRTAKARRNKALIEKFVEEEDARFPARPTLTNEIIWFLIGAACVVIGSRLLVYTGIRLAGADILDILWVLGGCSLIGPLPLNPEPSFLGFPQTQSLDIPIMLLLMIFLLAFGYSKGTLRRWQGGVLFVIYVIYIAVLFTTIR
jgi:cation:H+ antiporter